MQIEIETFVAAPPPVVFETLANFANWPQFMSGIARMEMLTTGPVAVGSRFRETRTMLGKSASEEIEVAEMAAPHRIVLTAHNHGTDYRIAHMLAAAAEGTQLSLQFAGTPVPLAARLFAPLGWLFAGSARKQIEKDLGDLKREAERHHATT